MWDLAEADTIRAVEQEQIIPDGPTIGHPADQQCRGNDEDGGGDERGLPPETELNRHSGCIDWTCGVSGAHGGVPWLCREA